MIETVYMSGAFIKNDEMEGKPDLKGFPVLVTRAQFNAILTSSDVGKRICACVFDLVQEYAPEWIPQHVERYSLLLIRFNEDTETYVDMVEQIRRESANGSGFCALDITSLELGLDLDVGPGLGNFVLH